FPRRTFDAKHPLRCKRGDDECMAMNRQTTCRKCRFTRLSSVLTTCTGGNSKEDKATAVFQIESDHVLKINDDKCGAAVAATTSTTFLDHEAY
ncbi:hypothetical protein PENTCL1PPCAC_14395, partial [Pristionchus entomophagus]